MWGIQVEMGASFIGDGVHKRVQGSLETSYIADGIECVEFG